MWEQEALQALRPVEIIDLDSGDDDDAALDDDDAMDTDDAGSGSDDEEELEPISLLDEEHPQLVRARARAFRRAWRRCEGDITDVTGRLYASITIQIGDFVSSPNLSHPSLARALPAGVILGINDTFTTALLAALRTRFSQARADAGSQRDCLVARLASRDCPNKKAAIRALISAVTASHDVRERHGVDPNKRPVGRKPPLVASDDPQIMLAWYHTRFGHKAEGERPHIVLFLEDVEAFDPTALTELLYVLSVYRDRIPFVLLLAISTSVDAINNLLPRRTAELLRCQYFTLTESSSTLNNLLFEIFIKRTQTVTLGPRAFAYLRDSFLDYDQSLDGLVSKLQYAYLIHFYGDYVTFLCDRGSVATLDSLASAARQHLFHHLRNLPSLQAHQEEEEEKKARDQAGPRRLRALRSDDDALLGELRRAIDAHEARSAGLKSAWNLLLQLQDAFETTASTESMLKEYFSGKLAARAAVACSSLRRSREDRCLSSLEKLCSSETELSEDQADDLHVSLRDQLQHLKDLIADGERQSGRTTFVNGNEKGGICKTPGDWQYTKLVAQVADELERYFQSSFRPLGEGLFSELWTFDDVKPLKKTFHPPIVSDTKASLITPSSRLPKHLLPSSATTTKEPFLSTEDSDTSAAYRLVADAGKLVNLADWYGAFQLQQGPVNVKADLLEGQGANGMAEEAVEAEEGQRRTPTKRGGRGRGRGRGGDRGRVAASAASPSTTRTRGSAARRRRGNVADQVEVEEEHNVDARVADGATDDRQVTEVRFLQSVADLAYLGMIQPSKRKAEHVARVVF